MSSPNIAITRRQSRTKNQIKPMFTFPKVRALSDNKPQSTASAPTQKKAKRRIRTFYSNGQWVYDFVKHAPIAAAIMPQAPAMPQIPLHPVPPPCAPPSPNIMDNGVHSMNHPQIHQSQHLSVDFDFGEA